MYTSIICYFNKEDLLDFFFNNDTYFINNIIFFIEKQFEKYLCNGCHKLIPTHCFLCHKYHY